MTQKTQKVIYWIGVVLTALWFATSGLFELTRNPTVWDKTIALGYPPHFIYVLGVAKLSGVIVLLVPGKLLRLKEWVFAGLFFDVIFAFTSGMAVFGPGDAAAPVIAFVMVLVTYVMFRKVYPVY
jgi:uncharacterized membrane protein YphA (DoxX/SURF4 family)